MTYAKPYLGIIYHVLKYVSDARNAQPLLTKLVRMRACVRACVRVSVRRGWILCLYLDILHRQDIWQLHIGKKIHILCTYVHIA